jgi:hypothetical protein
MRAWRVPAATGVAGIVIAGLAGALALAAPGRAAGLRGAPAVAVNELRAVAGDAATGVAGGVGRLWWSTPTHLVWYPAAGVDSSLVYTAVVRAGGHYLATAEDGSVWVSSDAEGKVFLRGASAAARPLRAIARVGNAAVVAVGDNGTIVRCADAGGTAWSALTSPVTTHLRGLASNGLTVVAVGDSGTVLLAGAAGTQWQAVAIGETRDLLGVIADPSAGIGAQYLAVGRDGAVWRGLGNGLTWTRLSGFTTRALRGAVGFGSAALAVGDGGVIYWSPGSFAQWQPAVSTVTTDLRAATLAGTDLLAVGADGSILWSINGREWQRADVPVPAREVSWGRVKQLFRR